ncbi:hypothetical protein H6P81_011884 [Aristolochia fimbriata]|uniref:Uncharacterized protein n=1 Tax=Aristolochia fimbriata TaxID=158543 RepID=A0AAV7EDC4_ARIFI|nr:hypothetical protein H6P81_011884 [Aristolochia fimbriata]
MGWSHPDVTLEDLLHLIKGFVDIVILASGYQSSGLPAIWDRENIRKVLSWGLFFEDVLIRLHDSDDYVGSVKELDGFLLELKSHPHFPQGLSHLSSATLAGARDFILGHFLQSVHLGDGQIRALLSAAIEMDLCGLSETESDCLSAYTEKLTTEIKSLHLSLETDGPEDSKKTVDVPGSPLSTSYYGRHQLSDDQSRFIIKELLQRQTTMSSVSSAETALDVLSNIFMKNKRVELHNVQIIGHAFNNGSSGNEEEQIQLAHWNQWRSRNLSYLFDKRTIRLVAGARLIFSAPKVQWSQIFERLAISNEAHNMNLLETLELSLLGIISSRWSSIVELFTSAASDHLPISDQFYEIHKSLQGGSEYLHPKDDIKENDILEHVMMLLNNQFHLLWRLAPVLAAAAIPSWSTLYRLYLIDIEKEMKRDSSTIRCCSCNQESKEHTEFKLAPVPHWHEGGMALLGLGLNPEAFNCEGARLPDLVLGTGQAQSSGFSCPCQCSSSLGISIHLPLGKPPYRTLYSWRSVGNWQRLGNNVSSPLPKIASALLISLALKTQLHLQNHLSSRVRPVERQVSGKLDRVSEVGSSLLTQFQSILTEMKKPVPFKGALPSNETAGGLHNLFSAEHSLQGKTKGCRRPIRDKRIGGGGRSTGGSHLSEHRKVLVSRRGSSVWWQMTLER